MAKKKTTKKEPEQRSCGRLFFGSTLHHECEYGSKGETKTVYHNDSVKAELEATVSKRLTEAAKQITAENPDSGLLLL